MEHGRQGLDAPHERDAAALVRRVFGIEARSVARFPAGLAHFVYDVTLADGRRVVARLARRGEGVDFAGAVRWHGLLRPRGVPLPALLAVDAVPSDGAFPYMLLERLPGIDLWYAYPALTPAQKRALARRIVAVQRIVGELPPGRGYGYGAADDDPGLHPAWIDVLHEGLRTARERIAAVGVVPLVHADRVAARLEAARPLLARVQPVCFLDDTTTKNVIVHEGRLSGIVDVDGVCFGDPLLTPALTRMSLLNLGHDTDYVRFWTDELGVGREGLALLDLYTANFGVIFTSELGVRFNRDDAPPVDPADVARLTAILDGLLDEPAP